MHGLIRQGVRSFHQQPVRWLPPPDAPDEAIRVWHERNASSQAGDVPQAGDAPQTLVGEGSMSTPDATSLQMSLQTAASRRQRGGSRPAAVRSECRASSEPSPAEQNRWSVVVVQSPRRDLNCCRGPRHSSQIQSSPVQPSQATSSQLKPTQATSSQV